MAAGYFLLLAQKKVTKENGTLGSAPLAQRAVRCGRTGFAHRPSMACRRNRRDPSRRPRAVHAAFPFALRRGSEGTREPALTLALSRERERGCVVLRRGGLSLLRQDCRALRLFPGPSRPRRAGVGNCPKGRAQDARAFDESTGTCSRRTPEPARAVCRHGCRQTADARVSFSWLLLFGQAKRSNRRPWMADEQHTDVSRLSRQRQGQKSKVKMDSGLRRNDERRGFRPSPE